MEGEEWFVDNVVIMMASLMRKETENLKRRLQNISPYLFGSSTSPKSDADISSLIFGLDKLLLALDDRRHRLEAA